MNIEIGLDVFKNIKLDIGENSKLFILTDDIVYSLYKDKLNSILSGIEYDVFEIKNGEKSKNRDTVFEVYDFLIDKAYDRSDVIMAFGGGVVGDLGGFIASTYMRGLKYIQVPTTLLAQVDSSVGGKTGFDYKGYKNIIGTFRKPERVIIDTSFLKTLSVQDLKSGLGEILKYGLIEDYELFEDINRSIPKIYNKDLKTLENYIVKSIDIKMKYVDKDYRDYGIRRHLNFGHTIGHSIESFYSFDKYKHGEAVILGMIYESYIGFLMNLIDEKYLKSIVKTLLKITEFIKFSSEEIIKILNIIKMDKKNYQDSINMILPIGIGEVDYFKNIDTEIIKRALEGEWIENFR